MTKTQSTDMSFGVWDSYGDILWDWKGLSSCMLEACSSHGDALWIWTCCGKWDHICQMGQGTGLVQTYCRQSQGHAMSGELQLSGMPAVPDSLRAVGLASDASGDVGHVLGMQGCIPGWWTMVAR